MADSVTSSAPHKGDAEEPEALPVELHDVELYLALGWQVWTIIAAAVLMVPPEGLRR